MAEGVGELLGQVVHVAFAEGDAVVVDDVGAFLDVGGDDAVAVAHGFQQAEGHPLEVAGQDEEAGVAVELFPQLTVYKAGEDDPFVAADLLFQLVHVPVGVGGAACDDQLFVGVQLFEGIHQIVAALFRHHPAQIEDVGVLFEAVLFPDDVGGDRGRGVDAVGDIVGGAAIGVQKVFLGAVVEHDDLMGAPRADLFTHADVPGAEGTLPLVPRPVQTVDGQDDPLAGQAGDPGEHGGAFRVDMDHVIGAESRRKAAEEAGSHSREALAVDGGQMPEADAPVLVQMLGVVFSAADVMAGAVVAGDGMAVYDHPRRQFFHHDLNAAFP